MLDQYVPIAILFVVSAALAVALILLGTLFGPRRGPRPGAGPVPRALLPHRRSLHPLRRRNHFLVSVGRDVQSARPFRPHRDGHLYRDPGGGLRLHLEEGGAGMGVENKMTISMRPKRP